MIQYGNKGVPTRRSVWIQEGIVLIALFFYLLLRVHPLLILELKPPAFFTSADFLYESLNIPGGLTDWLAMFFAQFWFSDFLAALFLALCLWAVAYATKKWMETLTTIRPVRAFHLIPAALFLALYIQYDFPLSSILAFVVNLGFLNLFVRWAPRNQFIRSSLSFILSLLLYWFTGGAFFVFAVLSGLDDVIFQKRSASGFLSLLFAAALPLAAFNYVFLVVIKQAYLHNMPFENPTRLQGLGYAIPAFYLLTMAFFSLAKVGAIRNALHKTGKRIESLKLAFVWKLTLEAVILIAFTVFIAQKSYDDTKQLALQLNQSARHGRWSDVLELASRSTAPNPLFSFQTNLALYNEHKLLDTMFAYPQQLGTLGLMMDLEWCDAWPEESNNFYWQLGLINESHHWATEAYELKGPSADILERLGMIFMLKGSPLSADRFFLKLGQIPFHGKTAAHLIGLNANPSELAQDGECRRILSCMPTEDYVSIGTPSYRQLEVLLKRNPRNRMAFEYLMAYYLLEKNLKGIADHLPYFGALGYSVLPRHIQEALLFIVAMNPKPDLGQLKRVIDPTTYRRFVEYQQILVRHKGDGGGARQELQTRFDDTYWYYLMFGKSPSKHSEYQHDYH
jgi:hypothetical protein